MRNRWWTDAIWDLSGDITEMQALMNLLHSLGIKSAGEFYDKLDYISEEIRQEIEYDRSMDVDWGEDDWMERVREEKDGSDPV